jgi:hypothetical protein
VVRIAFIESLQVKQGLPVYEILLHYLSLNHKGHLFCMHICMKFTMHCNTYKFYFGGLHPVAFVTKTLLWWPTIATKLLFPLFHSRQYTSARVGHLQVNTIVFLEASYCL